MTTLQKLNESQRLLAAGRDIQRRYDRRLIDARIQELEDQVRAENDLPAALALDELRNLRTRIVDAAK